MRAKLANPNHGAVTTVYKAGLSTVEHLYNLVTKIITKYSVLTTYKIFKNSKKTSPIFLKKIFVASSSNFFSKNWRFFLLILKIL